MVCNFMRMASKEFVVNKFILLKLEEGKTNIYINGDLFTQCKHLILNIPVSEIESLEGIGTIEEAVEKLESTERYEYEDIGYDITPEEEFLGHCSNLQAWVENGYNCSILHYSLSFSLLRKLCWYDKKALVILKEEIAKRLRMESESMNNILYEYDLVELLSREEINDTMLHPDDAAILQEVESQLNEPFSNNEWPCSSNVYASEDGRITTLNFANPKMDKIPEAVCKFKFLTDIYFADLNKIKYLPEKLKHMYIK